MLPTFLVIGAPRCGTTSLHYYLGQHPDVCMSVTKEPNYFLFDRSTRPPRPLVADDRRIVAKSVTGRAAYEQLFRDHGERAVGEASPLYLYTRETPQLIAAELPQAKLIAVLRDPVERAFSHFRYVHDSLGDATVTAFADAALAELGLADSPYHPDTHYLRLGRYAPQVQRYIDAVGRNRLLVLRADEVGESPAAAMQRICRFLDVDDGFEFDTRTRYNPATAGSGRRGRLDRLLRPARPYLKRALPAPLVAHAARRRSTAQAQRGAPPVPIPDDLRSRLEEYYADSNRWLARELGITVGRARPPD